MSIKAKGRVMKKIIFIVVSSFLSSYVSAADIYPDEQNIVRVGDSMICFFDNNQTPIGDNIICGETSSIAVNGPLKMLDDGSWIPDIDAYKKGWVILGNNPLTQTDEEKIIIEHRLDALVKDKLDRDGDVNFDEYRVNELYRKANEIKSEQNQNERVRRSISQIYATASKGTYANQGKLHTWLSSHFLNMRASHNGTYVFFFQNEVRGICTGKARYSFHMKVNDPRKFDIKSLACTGTPAGTGQYNIYATTSLSGPENRTTTDKGWTYVNP